MQHYPRFILIITQLDEDGGLKVPEKFGKGFIDAAGINEPLHENCWPEN
jgi:hypothetical protein